jgi:hypothetical protein
MKVRSLLGALAWAVASAQTPAPFRVWVTVPGTANPYLAGMPNGARADFGDRAPRQSPVAIQLPAGAAAVTFDAGGGVDHLPGCPPHCDSPEGSVMTEHRAGAENGIAEVGAPFNALMGVFLTDERPNKGRAPRNLMFDLKHRQFTTLSPQLKQVFFIGRGTTPSGEVRRYVIPTGATRLFLGTMDGYEWNNNSGAFSVIATVERTAVDSSMYSVDSSVSFAQWPCLPDRTRCTPAKEIVEERTPGQFHILLPAQMEWGVSVPTPPGSRVVVRDIKGTVCLNVAAETCGGSEGKGAAAGEGFLSPHSAAGSLVVKTEAGRTYFSVNDRSGAFQSHNGFFEFDVWIR